MGREKENYIEQLLKERDLERQVMTVPIKETAFRSWIRMICKFLKLPDPEPDPFVGGTNPAPDPDPSIIKPKK
jgi:hypothetical protein